jgi:hypothetical protein
MFQVNPSLTPNIVKMLLMYTAQQLAGANTFEQGAGEINIDGAVRLAYYFRQDLSSPHTAGESMFLGWTPYGQIGTSRIAYYSFMWSGGIILNYGYASGQDLIFKYQTAYGRGALMESAGVASGMQLTLDPTAFTQGVVIGDNILTKGCCNGSSPW